MFTYTHTQCMFTYTHTQCMFTYIHTHSSACSHTHTHTQCMFTYTHTHEDCQCVAGSSRISNTLGVKLSLVEQWPVSHKLQRWPVTPFGNQDKLVKTQEASLSHKLTTRQLWPCKRTAQGIRQQKKGQNINANEWKTYSLQRSYGHQWCVALFLTSLLCLWLSLFCSGCQRKCAVGKYNPMKAMALKTN